MSRLRAAALLVRPTLRSASWPPLAAGGALGLAILALSDRSLGDLRLAALAICVGAAFCLDDAAAATVASAPTPLLTRRALRLGLGLAPLAALWAVVCMLAAGAASWDVSLEFAAMLAGALAAAGIAARIRGDGHGGAAGGPALLTLVAGAFLVLPPRWGLFPPGPGDSVWDSAHQRWGVVLVAAVLGLLWASRDPAIVVRPRRVRLPRRSRPWTRSS